MSDEKTKLTDDQAGELKRMLQALHVFNLEVSNPALMWVIHEAITTIQLQMQQQGNLEIYDCHHEPPKTASKKLHPA